MTRRRLVAVAVAAATAALVLTPSAVLAHDPGVVWLVVEPSRSRSIGTAAESDAALTALPTGLDLLDVTGLDILDEQGYGVGVSYDDSISTGPVALIWDHVTGATAVTAGLTMTTAALEALLGEDGHDYDSVSIDEAFGLDAAPGADVLTLVRLIASWGGEVPVGQFLTVLASVDIGTGALVPIAVLDDSESAAVPWQYADIATDRSTGTVYLFGRLTTGDGETSATLPAVAVADPATGTVGPPTVLTGVVDAFGGAGGESYGADFESDGRLWLSLALSERTYWLLSIAPGFAAAAAPVISGDLDASGPPWFGQRYSLAVEDAPRLPDTGAPAPFALAGLALVLAAAGAGALALHRRDPRAAR